VRSCFDTLLVSKKLHLSKKSKLLFKAETHDATNRCNKSPRVTCENHCRCDRILSPRSVARIQTGLNSCDKISANSLVAACVRICDKSPRQNLNQPMREHQLVSRHVNFELVYISSLLKSIACTEQVSYRSDWSQHQCRREDLSPRWVAAFCRIVCLGLNIEAYLYIRREITCAVF